MLEYILICATFAIPTNKQTNQQTNIVIICVVCKMLAKIFVRVWETANGHKSSPEEIVP